jgi:acetyl-CoA C-acetyltransferase
VQALRDGTFAAEIVPVLVPRKKGEPQRVDVDEYPRAGTTAEKLAALKPAFATDGSVPGMHRASTTARPRSS